MLPVTLIKLRSYVEQIVIIYICVCLLSHVKVADVGPLKDRTKSGGIQRMMLGL